MTCSVCLFDWLHIEEMKSVLVCDPMQWGVECLFFLPGLVCFYIREGLGREHSTVWVVRDLEGEVYWTVGS